MELSLLNTKHPQKTFERMMDKEFRAVDHLSQDQIAKNPKHLYLKL